LSRADLCIINGKEVLKKHKGVIRITNKQIREMKPSFEGSATVKLPKDNRPFAQREAWSWLKRTVLLVFEQCGHEKREKSKLPPFTVF